MEINDIMNQAIVALQLRFSILPRLVEDPQLIRTSEASQDLIKHYSKRYPQQQQQQVSATATATATAKAKATATTATETKKQHYPVRPYKAL